MINITNKKNLLEEYELVIHKIIKEALEVSYEDFTTSVSSLSFDELLKFVSREDQGRGQKYKYSVEEVVQAYLAGSMNGEQERELKYRIASSSIYNVAMERYVFISIINYLNDKIAYGPIYSFNASPNSSDFSIIIENKSIQGIADLLNLQVDMEYLSNQYDGVIIHVDAKSIMAFKNIGDAITCGGILGKCEAKWNQISYIPPILEDAFRNDNSYMRKKHSVLDKTVYIGDKKYYTTSSFVVDLVYLDSDTDYFKIPIKDINGGSFNHLVYVITFPNGIHKSDFYDMFFNRGKEGYDKTEDGVNYPKDCRLIIMSENKYLKFKGLEETGKGTIYRFAYINADEKEYEIKCMNRNNELKTRKVIIPNI